MATSGDSRVIVGVDASPTGLAALRAAVAEARQRHAELQVVHVRPPVPVRQVYTSMGAGPVPPLASSRLIDEADDQARGVITYSIRRALGGPPADLQLRCTVAAGRPERTLTALGWRADDLLVIGASGGWRWRHPLRRSIGRYCVAHARCPVLVVPRSQLARSIRRRWVTVRRSGLPRDLWGEFDATAGYFPQHTK